MISAKKAFVFAILIFQAGCVSTERRAITQRLDALNGSPLASYSLGVPIATENTHTRFITDSSPDSALPVLRQSLQSLDRPILVGYAAFCLRQMEDFEGTLVAVDSLSELKKKGDPSSIEEIFARNELRLYIESASKKPEKSN